MTSYEPAAISHGFPDSRHVQILSGAGRHVSGLRISYREQGDSGRPAIVCLHGIGSNSTGFRYQLSGLSDEFRVVAWDAPGYGDSDEFPEEAPRVADYTGALDGLLEALEIESCHLVGSSMGALIGVAFAARFPDRVRSLVLSGPTIGRALQVAAQREAAVRSRIDDMARLGPEGIAETRSRFLVAGETSDETLAAVKDVMRRTRPRGYGQAARMIAATNVLPEAAAITAPTLILRGTEDKLGGGAEPLHEAIAGSVFRRIPNAGHLTKLEVPAAFNALVRDFVKQTQPA